MDGPALGLEDEIRDCNSKLANLKLEQERLTKRLAYLEGIDPVFESVYEYEKYVEAVELVDSINERKGNISNDEKFIREHWDEYLACLRFAGQEYPHRMGATASAVIAELKSEKKSQLVAFSHEMRDNIVKWHKRYCHDSVESKKYLCPMCAVHVDWPGCSKCSTVLVYDTRGVDFLTDVKIGDGIVGKITWR